MASLLQSNPAPGSPGVSPTWSRADKDGVGAARSGSSLLWYTVAGGIVTEVYHPDVDTPQIRDLQLLVTDGSTFFHDGTRNYNSTCSPIDPDALGLHLTKTAIGQPYSLTQDVIAEPGSSVLLVRTTITCDPAFLQRLHVYALAAPHLEGHGSGNNGYVAKTAKGVRLVAHRGGTWLAMGTDCGYRTTGCGFVGVNDGWQDIVGNRRLQTWTFDNAQNGNIALTGEIDLNGRSEFVLALAFGEGDANTPNSALVALAEALSYPFEAPANQYSHLSTFLSQWKNPIPPTPHFEPKPNATFDNARLFNYSRNVLLAHEDKTYSGALVASLSIPWGEIQGDLDGGYHLVWPRDMSQSATALLAAGELDMPLRGLIYLAASQSADGSFHQKFMIDGQPPPNVFDAQQLDEYSFPIMLAYRLSALNALQQFDPRPMVLAAAGALIANGPMTQQERWEENEGYSPSTLAANIAALVCAAHFAAQDPQDQPTTQFLLDYADFLESHVEPWTVTTQGTLLPGITRHFIRLLPTFAKGGGDPKAPEDPNNATIFIGNRGGLGVPAKEVVDAGFLELVRYGIRAGGDALIEDSLKVVDHSIKATLPQGPCWHRYTDDGYGQENDGGPFTGVGVGRPWPLLAGERAHYELAKGLLGQGVPDVSMYLKAMEGFAGTRGLLAEQLWDAADVPSTPPMVLGQPTGSAMPLAWAHAEYIRLVRSVSDNQVFDRIDIVADRYLQPHATSNLEVWNFARQIQAIPRGKRLRIPLATEFRLHWSPDGWHTVNDTTATQTAVGIYFADIPTDATTPGPLAFTFFWNSAGHWEGTNFQVNLT